MRSGRRIAPTTLALLISAAPAYAQSLAELVRQEEARRATTQKTVKVLSNADLRPQDITSPSAETPVESCYMSISRGCVSAEELLSMSNAGVVTKENAPFEPKWRRDAQSIRSQLEKAQNEVAWLDAVVADEGRSLGERKAAEKALAARRQAVDGLERQWDKFEKAAANKYIPRPWIEPIPTLTTRNPQ